MSHDMPSFSVGAHRAPNSSLRGAFVAMALLPAAMACLVAAAFLFAPNAVIVAGVALLGFSINALAMPLIFDRRISARLIAVADSLRAARDGRIERVPSVDDLDAIGDIARLANDIVAIQADIGRYAASLRNAEDFVRISDQMMSRFAGGAQGLERMLEGLQLTANHVSHSSERVIASMSAAANETDRTLRDFVSTASRAVRSADAMVASAGKAAAASAQLRPFETRPERPLQPDVDAVMARLDDLGRAIAGLPGLSDLRHLTEAATAPVIDRLAALHGQTHAALSGLEAPLIDGRRAMEAKLDRLEQQIATSRQAGDGMPQIAHEEIAALSEAVGRIQTGLADVLGVVSSAPAAPDHGPIVDSIERLERPLALLSERALNAVHASDLEPVVAHLTDIASRLSAMEDRIAAVPAATPHPDAGLAAEFDAARAPLQRLLVAFRLSVRAIGQESERLRATVDGISAPGDKASPVLDLSPISAQLDGIADRIAALEASARQSTASRATPDVAQLAGFDAGKAPLQRILVGLRLALRDISAGANDFRDTIRQIGEQPAMAPPPPVDLTPLAERLDDIAARIAALEAAARDSGPMRPAHVPSGQLAEFDAAKAPMQRILVGLRLALRDIAESSSEFREAVKQVGSLPAHASIPGVDLSPIAERMDDLARRFSSIEAVTREAVKTQPEPTALEARILPQLALDRTAMSTALTGLKLMMREIANEATALRAAAEALPGKVEIISPPPDLTAITGSLDALHEELTAGNGVLAEIHALLGRDALAAKEGPAGWADAKIPSLATTLSLMSAFSSAVETQFNEIEGRITDVAQRYLSGDGRAAADGLVTRLLEAASEMRSEVSKFLAVGAALSQQIETANGGRKLPPQDFLGTRSAIRLR